MHPMLTGPCTCGILHQLPTSRKGYAVVINEFETLWLTATNIVLGLVTLVCCIVIAYGLIMELKGRLAARRERLAVHADDHAFVLPLLGVTMADGGERLDKNLAQQEPTWRHNSKTE